MPSAPARSLPALLVAVLLVAGCLASPEAGDDVASDGAEGGSTAWLEALLPNEEDHDHFDRSQHLGRSTPNFEVIGFDSLETDHDGRTPGGYFCGDLATHDGRTLAVTHSFSGDVAFVVVDVTDPAQPTKIGEFVMENTQVWDLAITADQRYVLLATSPFGNLDDVPEGGVAVPPSAWPRMAWRDACTGTETPVKGPEASVPWHSGLVLVDIEDLAAMAVVDFVPAAGQGGHSIVVEDLGGDRIVFATVTNGAPANYYHILTVEETPLGGRLVSKSLYQTDHEALARGDVQGQIDDVRSLAINHDGSLQNHPITGQRLAYVADGDWGVTILDLADLTMPRVIARWDHAGEIANPYSGHFAHSILPIADLWDGRHYTFVSEECTSRPADTPTCLVYVLDTTDPTRPTLAGAYTDPVDAGAWSYPGFSPHYMAIHDRTLFLAH
ncbi:MAG TPA: hypothetical protein VM327_04370, partial [Candidatus Thermoplasmatota archaeon]|nr:hypothetical protein [Candidatus Thermoplasmatota archaeon]